MSEVTFNRCESCKKTTEDRYEEKGWIQLGPTSVSVSLGRRKDGQAFSRYRSGGKAVDFCSEKCLLTWVRSAPGPSRAEHAR